MFRIIRKNALGLALLLGLSPVQTFAASEPSNATYKLDQVIVVKEAGRADRRCIILSIKKAPDGIISYQVKALDNSEIMTIHERPVQDGGNVTPSPHATAVGIASVPQKPSQVPANAVPASSGELNAAPNPTAASALVAPMAQPANIGSTKSSPKAMPTTGEVPMVAAPSVVMPPASNVPPFPTIGIAPPVVAPNLIMPPVPNSVPPSPAKDAAPPAAVPNAVKPTVPDMVPPSPTTDTAPPIATPNVEKPTAPGIVPAKPMTDTSPPIATPNAVKPTAPNIVASPSETATAPLVDAPISVTPPPTPKNISSSITIGTAPQVAAAQPEMPAPQSAPCQKRTFFDRLFGRKLASCDTCSTCETQSTTINTVRPSASAVSTGSTSKVTNEPPMIRLPSSPSPMPSGPSEPGSVGFSPLLPKAAQQDALTKLQPVPSPVIQLPDDPVRENSRSAELKDTLKNAERPTQRIVAAEELSKGLYLQTSDIKAALMLAATDDPAGCVRAACIRCLSQQGVRDEAFMKVVAAAKSDKDAQVRQEAEYALKKSIQR